MRSGNLIPAVLAALVLASACGDNAPAKDTAGPPVPVPTLDQLPAPFNEADLEAGRQAFGKKCSSCHFIDRKKGHMVGPNLNGLFERGPAKAPGYTGYSSALKSLGGDTWNPAQLEEWLEHPRVFLPNSNMFFNGIGDADERRDIIAYLMIESRKR